MNIFMVTTLQTFEKDSEGLLNPGIIRTVGWFMDKSEAVDSIVRNTYDMKEGIYKYAVIEELGSGIYPMVYSSQWFEWDRVCEKWTPIENLDPELNYQWAIP